MGDKTEIIVGILSRIPTPIYTIIGIFLSIVFLLFLLKIFLPDYYIKLPSYFKKLPNYITKINKRMRIEDNVNSLLFDSDKKIYPLPIKIKLERVHDKDFVEIVKNRLVLKYNFGKNESKDFAKILNLAVASSYGGLLQKYFPQNILTAIIINETMKKLRKSKDFIASKIYVTELNKEIVNHKKLIGDYNDIKNKGFYDNLFLRALVSLNERDISNSLKTKSDVKGLFLWLSNENVGLSKMFTSKSKYLPNISLGYMKARDTDETIHHSKAKACFNKGTHLNILSGSTLWKDNINLVSNLLHNEHPLINKFKGHHFTRDDTKIENLSMINAKQGSLFIPYFKKYLFIDKLKGLK